MDGPKDDAAYTVVHRGLEAVVRSHPEDRKDPSKDGTVGAGRGEALCLWPRPD